MPDTSRTPSNTIQSAVIRRFFKHAIKHVGFLSHCVDSLSKLPSDSCFLFALPDGNPFLREMLNHALSEAGFDSISFDLTTSSLNNTNNTSFPGRIGTFLSPAHPDDNKQRLDQDVLIKAILNWNRNQSTTTFIFPFVFLWNRDPRQSNRSASLTNLLTFRRRMLLSFGTPIELSDFRSSVDASDRDVTVIRRMIMIHRHREVTIITGRPIETTDALIKRLMQKAEIKSSIQEMAASGRKSLVDLTSDAHRMIGEIATEYRDWGPRIWDVIFNRIFSRVYSGIEFDFDGLRRFRNMLGEKKKVLMAPCHRSHMDYISLSYGCYREGITPPLVAAGINLSFFPMGWLFRHTGAFFIRRSFKGLDLYPVIFRTYLIDLVHKFHPLEVFIEGGRSRSGRFRSPKLGFVGIVIDAIRKHEAEDVQILPISINYDRILEEQSYLNELSGKEKPKETLGSMLKSWRLLKQKYGKIYISFGTPISIQKRIEKTPDSVDLKEQLGLEIVYEISQRMSLTPVSVVASALLSLTYKSQTRAIGRETLIHHCCNLLSLIKISNPVLSNDLDSKSDPSVSFSNAIQFLLQTGYCIENPATPHLIQVPQDKRFGLDYLRNSLTGLYFPISMIIAAEKLARSVGQNDLLEHFILSFCPGFYPFPVDEIRLTCRNIFSEVESNPHLHETGLALIAPEFLAMFKFRAFLEDRQIQGRDSFELSDWVQSDSAQSIFTAIPETKTTDFMECMLRSLMKQKRISRTGGSLYRIKPWVSDLPVESDRFLADSISTLLEQIL